MLVMTFVSTKFLNDNKINFGVFTFKTYYDIFNRKLKIVFECLMMIPPPVSGTCERILSL